MYYITFLNSGNKLSSAQYRGFKASVLRQRFVEVYIKIVHMTPVWLVLLVLAMCTSNTCIKSVEFREN